MIKKMVVPLFVAAIIGWFVFDWSGGLAGAAAQEDPPPEILLDNGFRIIFDGVEYHDDTTSTWFYTVEETENARELSRWVLETPFCAPILDAGPEKWKIVDPDPQANLSGVQWKTKHKFQEGQFWVRLDTSGQVGITHVAAKGPKVSWGEIAGPTCVDEPPPPEEPPDDENPPTIHWVEPVGDGETYDVQAGETVDLVVNATDDIAIDRVEFLRWDAVAEEFVTIAIDHQAPYQATVSANQLNPTWNELDAASFDTAGNFSGWAWIWLYLPQDGPLFGDNNHNTVYFMPLLMR